MSADLVLQSSCSGCGSPSNLYGSNCKHMTLCFSCGKSMAQRRAKCLQCGAIVTRLIREYNIRQGSSTDKNFFIGRFVKGLPSFPRKKNGNNAAANKWRLDKEGLQGRQVSDSLREKYKNKPWVLQDEAGQTQYQGNFDGAAIAKYYVLFKQGNEFLAVPAGSWFNFNKVALYKQLTLEEAEEKIMNKKKAADGYGRWMMKAAKNGAALFGQVEGFDNDDNGEAGGGKGRKQTVVGVDDDEDEDEGIGSNGDEEELGMKNRLNKLGDDNDVEKGDDWEHEDIFSDDDEAVGNQEEGKDLEPEVSAPPEFLQDDDDDENEDENDEEEGEKEGGLSKSGKEIKELLRVNKNEEDDNVDDDNDEDMDDVDNIAVIPGVVPSKQVANSGSGKRKSNGDGSVMASHSKKIKTENEQKPPSIQKESAVSSRIKTVVPPRAAPSVKMEPTSSSTSCVGLGAVAEEEIRAVVMQKMAMTTTDLVARFKERLRLPEEKRAFADILKRICRINKGTGNQKSTVMLL